MRTIGRNEPCLCGSGKKYKKCCSVKESGAFKQAVMERETVDVQSEILRYAFSHSAFSQAVQKSFSKYKLVDDMRDTFYFFVGIWALFTTGISNGKTALERFASEASSNKSSLRPGLVDIVQSWVDIAPSIVKVADVDDRNLVVTDIFSKQSKKVKIIDELTEIPAKGALLSGYIVPFVDDVSIFFTSVLSFEDEVADKIEQVVLQKFAAYNAYKKKAASAQKGKDDGNGKRDNSPESFLQESFLDLLELFMSDEEPEVVVDKTAAGNKKNSNNKKNKSDKKIVKAQRVDIDATGINSTDIEWNNDQEAVVASLLEEQLKQEAADKTVIDAGYMLWRSYCEKKQPAIKNEKIYAAALHYIVLDKVSTVDKLTQKEAAELYDASPASVSSRSREMATVLEDELQSLD